MFCCLLSGYRNGPVKPVFQFPHNNYQNVCTFLRQMNKWLEIWKYSGKLGIYNQTFNALIVTNHAISDLTVI